MRATDWEFTNRALIFGCICGAPFALYALDPQNSTAAVANALSREFGRDPDSIARALLGAAAFLLSCAALIRTWSSSYLQARIVYAAKVRAVVLVAAGPYRHVRNPLYLANVLMAVSLGAMMSRLGVIVAVSAMLLFCDRLIRREESELLVSQGERYAQYCRLVPRLFPALFPRLASAGARAQWRAGLRAEFWYWGFAAALLAFAVTLNAKVFFALLGLSIAAFWMVSFAARRKSRTVT